MPTPRHATSEEQRAALGNVKRKPMQIDLLTGNLVPRPPKAGNGNHVLLKSAPDEKRKVAGMAYFAATGPEGKRCQHCRHLQDIPVWGKDHMTPEAANKKPDTRPRRVEADACKLAAEFMERRVQPGGIQFEPACKYFEAAE